MNALRKRKKRLGQTQPDHSQPDTLAGEKLLSRRQVAERWGVCNHTVARRECLVPIRLGRRLLRYRLADVLAHEQSASDQKAVNQNVHSANTEPRQSSRVAGTNGSSAGVRHAPRRRPKTAAADATDKRPRNARRLVDGERTSLEQKRGEVA